MTSRRVTQEDVARAAGVNPATVSLALRNDRSIPRSTCERIQQLAERLGYAPDPLLSALARYRNNLRPASFQGTLGWVAQTTPAYSWRASQHFAAYLKGAEARSRRLGYQLEVFDLGELDVTWNRAGGLAEARGIQGLLLCPQPNPDTDLSSFPWQKFSAVTFGYTLSQPSLHSVAAAHHRAMLQCCEEMHARSYRKIGFICLGSHDQRVNHNLLSAYLAFRHLHADMKLVDPYFATDWTEPAMRDWIRTQKLDGLITCDFEFDRHTVGWKIPKTMGVVSPMLAAPETKLAGVWESNEEIASAAVDFLVGMIQRGEKGVPKNPHRLLVEGAWCEGETLRPRPPAVEQGKTDQPALSGP